MVSLYSGQPVWTKPIFANRMEISYLTNPYVYRCVNIISQACAGIPWILYNTRGGDYKEVDSSPLLTLMNRPNPMQGQSQFVENAIAYLLLSGDSYIERVGPKNGVPRELYCLRPDKMYVVAGDRINPVRGYDYKDYGQTVHFEAKQILHLKTFSPLDYWYGLSPVGVADKSIVAQNAAKAWNVALLQNSARPSGALVTEQNLNDMEFNRLKSQMLEKYEGVFNAGKPLLLEGGMDWKQMALSPIDMNYLEGIKQAAREIAITFGIDPSLIGDSSSKTLANYEQANKALYTQTVLPKMDFFRDELNNWLTPLFGDNLYLDYDRDSIEAIQEDRQIVWNQAIDGYKAGIITTNEAREMLGYGEFPSSEPETEEPPAESAPKEEKQFNLNSRKKKEEFQRNYESLRNSQDEWVKSLLSKQFTKEGKLAYKNAKNSPTLDSIAGNASKAINQDEWLQIYVKIYKSVMETFGWFTVKEVKSQIKDIEKKQNLEDIFDIWTQAALTFVSTTTVSRVAEIVGTTNERISHTVEIGLLEGYGIDKIASSIQALYTDMSRIRAETIARTEVIAAGNAGSRYSAMATGFDMKKNWLATMDRRTRPAHRAIDGESQLMNDLYSNGLMFPGDPNGSGSQVVNCRCTEWYEVIE